MDWYSVVESNEKITQGDILFDCPIFSIDPNTVDVSSLENIISSKAETKINTSNVVVLTQACDLENVKVGSVVVAPLYDIKTAIVPGEDKVETPQQKYGIRWGFIKDIYAGNRPSYTLIGEYDESFGFQIVNFSKIFTIPYGILDNFKDYHGPRLRLNTPHRELLSQQFGQFFSRIGLPNDDHISEKQLNKVVRDIYKI